MGAPAWVTAKALVSVVVPPGAVTETSLGPRVAAGSIVILAVIWVAESTVKLLTVMSAPKLTTVAPVK